MPLIPSEQLAPASGDAPIVGTPPRRGIWPIARGTDDPLAFLAALSGSSDDIVSFDIGRRPAFLLNDPALVDDVLVRRTAIFPKGRGYQHAARLLGSGLLTASGALHRDRRRVAQGAFHRQRVASLAPAIVRHAEQRSSRWNAGEPFDAAREMRALTLAIAGETLFGADLERWSDTVHEAVSLALSPLDGLLAIVAPPARARRARRQLAAVVDAVVDARTRDGNRDGGRDGRRGDGAAGDLLAMLLEARDAAVLAGSDAAISQAQLHDDVLTFLLASHDTLSHALTWTWLLLSEHADVDRRLAAEITDVAGTRAVQADDVPRLVYTRAVVAEALRLYPPAWVIVRRAAEACQVGSMDIPAGSVLVASPFAMHRRERFFERPLEFLPERWLVESDRPKLAYVPFGAGPRACIGESFAWFEATIVLATLARSWRLERTSHAPVETSARITLRPKDEPPMIPVAREFSPV
ncbi:MAG: cytochrome P450 [Vicinamibacterales bacterium]